MNAFHTAAQVLRHGRWTKGTLKDENGCYCATGALGVALGVEPDVNEGTSIFIDRVSGLNDLFRFAGDQLRKNYSEHYPRNSEKYTRGLVNFNDWCNDPQEVIDALDKIGDEYDRRTA